jgi:hypothetical protein
MIPLGSIAIPFRRVIYKSKLFLSHFFLKIDKLTCMGIFCVKKTDLKNDSTPRKVSYLEEGTVWGRETAKAGSPKRKLGVDAY